MEMAITFKVASIIFISPPTKLKQESVGSLIKPLAVLAARKSEKPMD
jgi:hypothetical protein